MRSHPGLRSEIAAVAVGGALGTTLRLAIDAALPHTDGAFPLSTLVINTVGSLVLGVFVARVWRSVPRWVRAGLGPGLVGSFTTFSAVAVSLVSLGRLEHWGTAVGYLLLTVVLGISAAALGLGLGRPTGEYEE